MNNIVILFLALSTGLLSSSAQGCVFSRHTLASLSESRDFQILKKIPVPYPKDLFTHFADQIGEFNHLECKDSVQQFILRHKATQHIYSLFSSHEDRCDGGNSYGVIVNGLFAEPQQALATIQDSFIYCL